MCKRLIQACPMSKNRTTNLTVCSAYDKNKYPNMFSSGWFYDHARRNKSNVKNSIKYKFCNRCETKNKIYTQPECDQKYKKQIMSCVETIKDSFVGQIETSPEDGLNCLIVVKHSCTSDSRAFFTVENVAETSSSMSVGEPQVCMDPLPNSLKHVVLFVLPKGWMVSLVDSCVPKEVVTFKVLRILVA
ncbi:hypothetical protein LTR56_015469 [Elasticomyces elasticus]|nr:hypothetical protein LTR22_022149 [Elasticomyces elasticus]KAK3634123.1 hypothetical protein LTR56_015469 [Elasticomyces elasticus]KAK4909958.1 hypothetical protein LTR49_021300 [Elasticomyces elasticus]KAK5754897.1 hypothetical protein LTS12_015020 [Elasticomyces elasticus]